MIVKSLIEQLKEYPENATVKIYDVESEEMETITGFLYDSERNELELCSDDPS